MATVEWMLDQWLEKNEITRYELAKKMGGNDKSRLTSLYRMREPQRIDLKILAEIIEALRKITNQDITVNDLLKFVPNPRPVKAQRYGTDYIMAGMEEVLIEYERGFAQKGLGAWLSVYLSDTEVYEHNSFNYDESAVLLIKLTADSVRPFVAVPFYIDSKGETESFWVMAPMTLVNVPDDASALRLTAREGGLPIDSTVLGRHLVTFSPNYLSSKTPIVLDADEMAIIRDHLRAVMTGEVEGFVT